MNVFALKSGIFNLRNLDYGPSCPETYDPGAVSGANGFHYIFHHYLLGRISHQHYPKPLAPLENGLSVPHNSQITIMWRMIVISPKTDFARLKPSDLGLNMRVAELSIM